MQIQAECGLSPWSHRDYMEELVRTDSILLKASVDAWPCSGFIVGRRVPGAKEGSDAEIYNIGVLPEARRNGVGTALMNEFFSICRRDRVENIWLDVRSSNKNARAFYRRYGFSDANIRPLFYRDPDEDAVVMRLAVAENFLLQERNIA